MKHLCENCREIAISDEAVASIQSRLSSGNVVYVVREPHVPGIEYLKSSAGGVSGERTCHLCVLLLRSLKDPRYIGTDQEDSGLPEGPISLDMHIRGDEIVLIARSGDTFGNPIAVSAGSDESCRGAEVSMESDSDEIFLKILAWCSDCIGQHEHCSRTNNKEAWLPSRVIDVGSPGGKSEVRLCDTRGRTGRYITLTHRWTKLTEDSGTTRLNFQKRGISIDVRELSETFQDAVEVTRKLGIQYLWIDAVCIIQDSREDWRTEAKNMASIYELAWLNIAGAGSEAMNGRLFMKRDSKSNRPCRMPRTFSKLSQIQSKHLGEDTYAYLSSEFYAQSVFTGFLSRRGWILQERLLSPRTVYFTKDEVYWECNHMIASESVPWGWTDHTSIAKVNSHWSIPGPQKRWHIDASVDQTPKSPATIIPSDSRIENKRLSIAVQPTILASLYQYWHRIVETYSNKKLTVMTDKLPAIYGIAQALHRSRMASQKFDECYYNGIWIADLARELLWIGEPGEPSIDYLVTNTVRLFTDRMPTYTWASCMSSVKFLLTSAPRLSHVENIHPLPEEQEVYLDWLDRVSSSYVSLPHFKTRTPPGSLELKGQLEIGTLHMDTPELINYNALVSGLLNFQDNPSLIPNTILDASCMTYETLNWLEISRGTVWCLAIATTDEASLSDTVKWPTSSSDTTASECTLGLILIPTVEFLLSLHKSIRNLDQDLRPLTLWDEWYLTKTPVSFRRVGVYKSRDHPPPSVDVTTIVLA